MQAPLAARLIAAHHVGVGLGLIDEPHPLALKENRDLPFDVDVAPERGRNQVNLAENGERAAGDERRIMAEIDEVIRSFGVRLADALRTGEERVIAFPLEESSINEDAVERGGGERRQSNFSIPLRG